METFFDKFVESASINGIDGLDYNMIKRRRKTRDVLPYKTAYYAMSSTQVLTRLK